MLNEIVRAGIEFLRDMERAFIGSNAEVADATNCRRFGMSVKKYDVVFSIKNVERSMPKEFLRSLRISHSWTIGAG